jgi:molecular chaperone HtpG
MSDNQTQNFEFQAEVTQLLHLVTHSLYSNPDIFLRELISNASDACDKLRFEAQTDDALMAGDTELRIQVEFDKDARTITIDDNGIGMDRDDAISNLGTIAKSGTKDFINKIKEAGKADENLIGQFGVGFYSGFIVADKIEVETRKAGTDSTDAVRWTSDGSGKFTIEPIDKATRGTRITLHLNEDSTKYVERSELTQIINRYSDHVSLPVEMKKTEWVAGEGDEPGHMKTLDTFEAINKGTALWKRDKSEISDEEYQEFYKNLGGSFDEPLTWTHNQVEGSQQYTQLLYVPSTAPHDLYQREQKRGLKLYVKRVFIMDDAEQLLPMYLRFIKGVIDSSDLPLNVSREILQESKDVRGIREGNTRRALIMLEKLAKDPEQYAKFFSEFGQVLKEGLGEDMKNQEKIAGLLRFASTTSSEQNVSFTDYKARMGEGQSAIYYLTAETLSAAKNSPQLELFKKKGVEVLLMSDRVDEWAMSFLTEFDGTPLKNIAKGAVDLGELEDEASKEATEAKAEEFKELTQELEKLLGDRVKSVRVSNRLVDSAALVVVEEGEMTPQLAAMLKQMGQEVPDIKPSLEINPDHALVARLKTSEHKEDLAQVILDQALLAEGGQIEDMAGYLSRVNKLLVG